jgi:hypothetical protein
MNSQFEAVLLLLVVVVIYAVARLMFLRTDEQSNDEYRVFDPRLGARFDHKFADSSLADKALNTAPVADDLGRVRVMQFNFAHFDAFPGPPDPECFADELILELYEPATDFRWTVTYVIATPSGIRKFMDDQQWTFFYATEIFIVRRYDLENIRRAVYGRLKEIHEEVAVPRSEQPAQF